MFAFIVYCACTVWMMLNTALASALAEREQKNTNKVRICAFITVILAVWTIIYGLLVAFYQLGQATPNQQLIYRIEEEAQAKLA